MMENIDSFIANNLSLYQKLKLVDLIKISKYFKNHHLISLISHYCDENTNQSLKLVNKIFNNEIKNCDIESEMNDLFVQVCDGLIEFISKMRQRYPDEYNYLPRLGDDFIMIRNHFFELHTGLIYCRDDFSEPSMWEIGHVNQIDDLVKRSSKTITWEWLNPSVFINFAPIYSRTEFQKIKQMYRKLSIAWKIDHCSIKTNYLKKYQAFLNKLQIND